ncbi:unnamed protein product [Anisakis simplex]|uniref:RxLR effector protein n=1 Tax=Anisakis simplex TaxID=6269 RepID=A0A0M3JTR2_ANISI|nr:unnamed protein product [Anisakis simplex]
MARSLVVRFDVLCVLIGSMLAVTIGAVSPQMDTYKAELMKKKMNRTRSLDNNLDIAPHSDVTTKWDSDEQTEMIPENNNSNEDENDFNDLVVPLSRGSQRIIAHQIQVAPSKVTKETNNDGAIALASAIAAGASFSSSSLENDFNNDYDDDRSTIVAGMRTFGAGVKLFKNGLDDNVMRMRRHIRTAD